MLRLVTHRSWWCWLLHLQRPGFVLNGKRSVWWRPQVPVALAWCVASRRSSRGWGPSRPADCQVTAGTARRLDGMMTRCLGAAARAGVRSHPAAPLASHWRPAYHKQRPEPWQPRTWSPCSSPRLGLRYWDGASWRWEAALNLPRHPRYRHHCPC